MKENNPWRYMTIFTEEPDSRFTWNKSKKSITLDLEPGETLNVQLSKDTRLVVTRDEYGDCSITREKRVSAWVPVDED